MYINLLLCFTLLFSNLKSQPIWQLIKDKNNIKVYTADAKSSKYKQIKVVGEFDGTPEKLIALFLDVPKQKEWVYGTKQAKLVKKISNNELLYYVETSLPWPVSNRDVVIHMKIDRNRTGNLYITTRDEPNAVAENKGKVRVSKFTGDWTVKVAGKNKLDITYLLFVDPGGTLPSWAVNLFISKGPYQTFSKLGEQLKR